MNQPWIYMYSPSWSPLPPPSPPDPSGSSQCTRPEHLSHASNLGWWSVSPEIIYMFRCCSLETSHPLCVGLYSCFGLSWKKFPGKRWRVHWKVLVFINSTNLISSFCWFKMPVKNTPTASARRSSRCLLLPFPRVGLRFRAHTVSPEHPLGMYPAPA